MSRNLLHMRAVLISGWIAILANASLVPTSEATNQPAAQTGATNSSSQEVTQPKTLAELLALKPDELEKIDVGLIDLLCAEGLRGSEDLDVQQCLKTLDILAEHVKAETERNRHRFLEHPEKFNFSEGYFRMKYLATILQQDFGVRYNPERAAAQHSEGGKIKLEQDDVFFTDSKDVFIHGLLTHKHFGTCASMPALYVAIARRLGYPVYLATTQAHGYVRYEEGNGQHFNVEATCVGFKTFPDDYYKNWPFALAEEDVNKGYHLRSLNNRLLLGRLLIERAGCLTSMKRLDEAAEVWQKALPYLTEIQDAPRYARRAENKRDMEKWYSIWNEVGQLPIPEGPRYSYFQNLKVQVHTFMAHSVDIPRMEKLVGALKEQAAAYQQEMQPVIDAPQKFEISIWPIQPEQMPEPLMPQELVRLKQMIPQLMHVPMEMIPQEYWRGMPAELQARLQLLAREDVVVSEMHAFAAEETQIRNLEARAALNRYPTIPLPPGQKPQTYIRSEDLPLPWRGRPIPPELQDWLTSLNTISEPSVRQMRARDMVNDFFIDQDQRRMALDAIARRRQPLQQELLLRQQMDGRTTPPWQQPNATENPLFPQPQLPLTP